MLSDEIIEQRRGKITASAVHSMMAGWDAPRPSDDVEPGILKWIEEKRRKPKVGDIKSLMECPVNMKTIDAAWALWKYEQPTQGLLTYAEELACEELFERDPMIYTGDNNPHIINGREREVAAMEHLSDAVGIKFIKTGEDQVHISEGGIGCTPDGIALDEIDMICAGAEVKCRSPLHHARQLLIHDNDTLLEHDFHRYCQIQVCMEVTGLDEWYSASYNPYALNIDDAFHYCLIGRDVKFLAVFRNRAEMVFKHKALFLDKLSEARDKRRAK